MKKIIHKAHTRGHADHGWLKANHSFSFGQWYDPDRIHFGALRVLNDDKIAPSMGFGTHPHDNMEIITIPLSGSIRHKDNMGNDGIIKTGEVQVMSAGTGVTHSEFNGSESEALELFQIWIIPNERNVQPRYAQRAIDVEKMKNSFLQVVGPKHDEEHVWIHQNAYIHLAEIDEQTSLTYSLKSSRNGIYFMIIDGEVQIDDAQLKKRDALEIIDEEKVTLSAITKSKLLVLEVPMTF